MVSGDWDFSTVNWTATGAQFRSSPSSLVGTTSAAVLGLAKKASVGQNVPNGILEFWVRSADADTLAWAAIRCKSADGSASLAAGSIIFCMEDDECWIKKDSVAAAKLSYFNFTQFWSLNTWTGLRLTHWSAWQKLLVNVEYDIGAGWVLLCTLSTYDHYPSETVARSGLYFWDEHYLDDVDISGE